MARFAIFYEVEAANLSAALGSFAYPSGEPRTDEVISFKIEEVSG